MYFNESRELPKYESVYYTAPNRPEWSYFSSKFIAELRYPKTEKNARLGCTGM